MIEDTRPLIVKIRDENKAKLEKRISKVQLTIHELSELKKHLKSKLKRENLNLVKFHKKFLGRLNISIKSFSGMLNSGGTKLNPEVLKAIKSYLRRPDNMNRVIISDYDLAELKYQLWAKLRFERADHIYFHKKYLSGVDVAYQSFMSMLRPTGVKITAEVADIVAMYVNGPDSGY